MIDGAKKIMEDAQALREIMLDDCIDFPRVVHTMCHKAADLIESLSAELEATEAKAAIARGLEVERDQLKARLEHVEYERDAAVEELRTVRTRKGVEQ